MRTALVLFTRDLRVHDQPALAAIDGPAVHEPWKLGPLERQALDYPEPIVDHDEAAGRFWHVATGDADQPSIRRAASRSSA